MPRIALILGSARVPSNGAGIAAWVSAIAKARFNESRSPINEPFTIDIVDPSLAPHPLGPIRDGTSMPRGIKDPALYSSPAVRKWSELISSCDGFFVVTPQFNHSYPGELKNSFDHLYWEWHKKPVALITYGGRGGGKANSLLRDVLTGAFEMTAVDPPVEISVPIDFITGEKRIPVDHVPEFLLSYESKVQEAVDHMKELLSSQSSQNK